MYSTGGYPDGAEYDSRAPWNRPDNKPRKIPVEALITLRHKCNVKTEDYEYCEDLLDGGMEIVVSKENLENAYKDCHRSISDLMDILKEYAEKELEKTVSAPRIKWLKDLITDCEGWEEEEIIVEY